MAYINGHRTLQGVRTKYLNVDDVYPVGSVYVNVNNTSPASLFGGTWEALNSGNLIKIPLNDLEVKTKNATHSVSGNSMIIRFTNGTNTGQCNIATNSSGEAVVCGGTIGTIYGGIEPVNLYAILQNTLHLYMWKRTA